VTRESILEIGSFRVQKEQRQQVNGGVGSGRIGSGRYCKDYARLTRPCRR